MNVPIAFACEKCGQLLQSKDQNSSEKIICQQCGYENTPPKGYTPPDSVSIKVKKNYFGD